jgi:hypothetical protein
MKLLLNEQMSLLSTTSLMCPLPLGFFHRDLISGCGFVYLEGI